MLADRFRALKRCGDRFSRRASAQWMTRRATVPGSMRHLFVCTNVVASGKPACGRRGGDAVMAAVQRKLLERGAHGVLVTPCGCLGPCFDGPNAVVYPGTPDGVWYGGLTVDDADALVDHLIDGVIHEPRRVERPGE
jgi:(2Fe-2S) ferredoxin